jgi:hypothetical protein
MRRRPSAQAPAYVPIPPHLAQLQADMTQSFLEDHDNSKNRVDLTSYVARPWPRAGDLPHGLGYTAGEDRDFARTNAAETASIGWQGHMYQPLWNEDEWILAKKRQETQVTMLTAQSRRHELNQFHSARVLPPPQSGYEIPDYQW